MELKDWLNSINKTKLDLLMEDDAGLLEKEYNPYIINRILSYFPELIYLVNEMNKKSDCDKKFQYHFLLHSVEKRNRFSPWQKQDKSENLDTIKKYYNYNSKRANEILYVLKENQIRSIKEKLDRGTKVSVEKVKNRR